MQNGCGTGAERVQLNLESQTYTSKQTSQNCSLQEHPCPSYQKEDKIIDLTKQIQLFYHYQYQIYCNFRFSHCSVITTSKK
jgi:hypothetical protein